MSQILSILLISIIILVLLRYLNFVSYGDYEGFEGSSRSVVICKADWCGHCKKAAPEFQKLLSASPITLKDGSKISVKILDADKDKAEVAKYDVKGFPSVLIVDGGQSTEYPGPRTSDGILSFLNSNY